MEKKIDGSVLFMWFSKPQFWLEWNSEQSATTYGNNWGNKIWPYLEGKVSCGHHYTWKFPYIR